MADDEAQGRLAAALEETLCAIWVRARMSLGGATLKAVFDRVLDGAKVRWPHLAFIEVTCAGVRFDREAGGLRKTSGETLAASFHHVARELVLVLGSLSGQVLTHPLRAAVDEVSALPRRS
ncbi:MAG: hypothetical protein ACYC8T_15060 [Myxococcaceae bacterium]